MFGWLKKLLSFGKVKSERKDGSPEAAPEVSEAEVVADGATEVEETVPTVEAEAPDVAESSEDQGAETDPVEVTAAPADFSNAETKEFPLPEEVAAEDVTAEEVTAAEVVAEDPTEVPVEIPAEDAPEPQATVEVEGILAGGSLTEASREFIERRRPKGGFVGGTNPSADLPLARLSLENAGITELSVRGVAEYQQLVNYLAACGYGTKGERHALKRRENELRQAARQLASELQLAERTV